MQKEYQANDVMSFEDKLKTNPQGLRGVVQIFRRNKKTGEVSFWDESENTITISGYQFFLMKAFGLYLDSKHTSDADNLTRDTTLEIPDMNTGKLNGIQVGRLVEDYDTMNENISAAHICQGFMIGTGGAGEDSVTTKNTSYSFVNLRRPIPFQQIPVDSMPGETTIAGKYLGVYHGTDPNYIDSYFIKKFDSTPRIYHSWWVDGQRWDYVDKVTQAELGPRPEIGSKTDRIETYIECKLSLSDTDCQSFFKRTGEEGMINELGLVAFNTVKGTRSIVEDCYHNYIKDFLEMVYTINESDCSDEYGLLNMDVYDRFTKIGITIYDILDPIINSEGFSQPNLVEFLNALSRCLYYPWNGGFSGAETRLSDILSLKEELVKESNIGVTAFYDQNGTFHYTTDKFLELLQGTGTSNLTLDKAERVKLVTYYTFNSIPISENWEILINYRIYAN